MGGPVARAGRIVRTQPRLWMPVQKGLLVAQSPQLRRSFIRHSRHHYCLIPSLLYPRRSGASANGMGIEDNHVPFTKPTACISVRPTRAVLLFSSVRESVWSLGRVRWQCQSRAMRKAATFTLPTRFLAADRLILSL